MSSPSGDVSDYNAKVTANVNLPNDLRAKINFTDKTANSVRPRRRSRRVRRRSCLVWRQGGQGGGGSQRRGI